MPRQALHSRSAHGSLTAAARLLQLVATACAFIGFKVEEAHQKVRYVINSSWDAWHGGRRPRLAQDGDEFRALRQSVLDMERIVLYTLEFDIAVEHPFPLVRAYLLALKEAGVFAPLGWGRAARNKEAPPEVVQANSAAINMAFESGATDACLLYTPPEIAAAAIAWAFGFVCAGRGVDNPVSWEALRKVVVSCASQASSGGSSGAGAGAPSSSSTPQSQAAGNTSGAAGAGLVATPLGRPLEMAAVHGVVSRFVQHIEEAQSDMEAALAHGGAGEDANLHARGAAAATMGACSGSGRETPYSGGFSTPFTPSEAQVQTPGMGQ